jgi:hypothetical protein
MNDMKVNARNLFFWIGGSLIAIVTLEHNAMLGLGFAVLAGIGLGLLLFVK